jgi:hypothetical protein
VDFHQRIDHLPLATRDARHVDTHRAGHDTQALRGVDERDGLGAVDDVLAGQAGHVRAGAANHRAFDDDGFLFLARKGPGEDFARDPAANDQVLIVLAVHGAAPSP